MNRSKPWIAAILGMVFGAILMVGYLAHADRLRPAKPDVLVSLAQTLDAQHKQVDVLLKQGDVAGAIAVLEDARTLTWPSREQAGDTAVVLRHDTYGRLLRLRLDHPSISPQDPSAMLTTLTEGLGQDYKQIDTNLFTARLLAIHGELLVSQGQDEQALTAYEEALTMNRQLLTNALAGSQP